MTKYLTTSVVTVQIVSVLIATMMLVAVSRQALRPAPFEYTDARFNKVAAPVAVYEAERSVLHAGDTLRFEIHLRVTNVPTVIKSFGKIVNRRTGRAVAGTFGPVNPPVPYASSVSIHARLPILLPADLPSGQYAYEVVAEAEGREFSGFIVYFRVNERGGPR